MATIRSNRRALAAGFTLIELMITVAVIGILAGVAYPAYGDYVRRAQLPEAFSAMQDYRIKMEQYFQDYKNYGTAPTCAGSTSATWKNFVPNGAKNFTYACVSTTTGYTITATGVANSKASGHVYTITEANVQGTTKFKNATVAKSCWLVKGSEC
ncbi:MAG TPA: type IV pilin protein [Ramlibacter sp.]